MTLLEVRELKKYFCRCKRNGGTDTIRAVPFAERRCERESPSLKVVSPGQQAACHL